MSRVFLSFLGTGQYEVCDYAYGPHVVQGVAYIQEALVAIFCKGFAAEDRICIFVTDKAASANWDGPGMLRERLEQLRPDLSVVGVPIAEGSTETAVWDVFQTVYDHLRDGDEVLLDITHGFRSLPALCMVLLDYARFLKNTTVQGIYYGAREARQRSEGTESGRTTVPIFDLTSFERLERWSAAADNLVNFGRPEKLVQLLREEAKSAYLSKALPPQEAARVTKAAGLLCDAFALLSTVRGRDIVGGSTFGELRRRIGELSAAGKAPRPLLPLLHKLAERLGQFGLCDVRNDLVAVRWCCQYGLVQQGITLLQESMITLVLDSLGLDWTDELNRRVVSDCFKAASLGLGEDSWSQVLRENRQCTTRILGHRLFGGLARPYERLRDCRNDINHAGFVKAMDASHFSSQLRSVLDEVEAVTRAG